MNGIHTKHMVHNFFDNSISSTDCWYFMQWNTAVSVGCISEPNKIFSVSSQDPCTVNVKPLYRRKTQIRNPYYLSGDIFSQSSCKLERWQINVWNKEIQNGEYGFIPVGLPPWISFQENVIATVEKKVFPSAQYSTEHHPTILHPMVQTRNEDGRPMKGYCGVVKLVEK